jgi:hypothetical protein
MAGSRLIAASIFPRSLRAGTTTETDGAAAGTAWRSRATLTWTSAAQRMPGSGATHRLSSPLTTGT